MEKLIALSLFGICLAALGGWERTDENSDKIKSLAQIGTKRISDGMNSPNHYKVVEVVEAKQQVVAGMNYELKIIIEQTTCRKGLKSFEEAQKCLSQVPADKKSCVVKLWEQQWLHSLKVREFSCSNVADDVEKKTDERKDYKEKLHRKLYEKFLQKYQKTYSTEYEKEKRFRNFKVNLKRIKELNENEKGTATYGITQFADLSGKEFRMHYLGLRPDLTQPNDVIVQAEIPEDPIPKSFDWREHNAVTEVKNQGQCGSCWAFSTTGNIEGQWAIDKKKLISLSEQELVDCDKVDEGCNGGLPSNAYKEIVRLGGLETEKEYPYEAEGEKCAFKKSDVRVYINSSVAISKNETKMAAWLVKNGPISIGINANAMQFYFGGISHPWKFLCNPANLDHGVLIVGYGVHTYPLFKKTLPFWIIKNSWGASWGEQGYYRVYRGDGTCGLNLMATSSVIN